ncbi:hypothetical protein B1748_08050 [Paenibacillus sp. MY03]|uniref:metallophosphoesterase family protein n=1 Tax=Paenibacillus sp. MY03 TaxID=302980 RepID=UPI000B3CD690|nr:metallophosphoesterase [Paenibacillus sp. MY03]OUS77098.1 hypothetical protein B1748_08050 [Paenibacillus sp. MY03]
MKFEHVWTANEKQALIRVEGLARPTVLFHITDSHMQETDDRDGIEIWAESVRQYSFDALETRTQFNRALDYANELAVDHVVLTGDIINGATLNNLDYLDNRLQTLRSPYLYTPGNHDWEYPFEPWSEAARSSQYAKFDRFTNANPSYQSTEVNGINLVAIDNSTYQITGDQLDFMERQLAKELPTLLFMHIPIYIPSLLEDVMREWRSPIMMAAEGWDAKLMAEWMIEEPRAATIDFYRILMDNPYANLIGLFCGHIHFAHRDAFGRGTYQYVTKAGFSGGYRTIRLLPMS